MDMNNSVMDKIDEKSGFEENGDSQVIHMDIRE